MPARRAPQHEGVLSRHGDSLLQITSALVAAVAQEDIHEAVVDHLAAALGASSVGLWLVDEQGRAARLARHAGDPDAAGAITTMSLDLKPSMPVLDAMHTGEPLWLPSQAMLLREYPHLASTVTTGGACRISCLPLVAQDRVLGALAITIPAEPEAPREERDFLRLVAMCATQAIEHLRSLEAERRGARRMEVLGHASRVFGQADVGHAERLEVIVREVGRLLDCANTIALVREDGRLHNVAAFHPNEEANAILRHLSVRAPINPGEGVTGKVIQDGQSVFLPSVDAKTAAALAAPAYRLYVERFPIHAAMAAPMRVRGRITGVINATRTRPGETFTRADLEMLEALGERAAAAIETSRLHEESERARQRAEQLYLFANAAVLARTLEEVYEAALDAILRALQAERASVLLFDDTKVMRFRAWRGLSDRYRAAAEGHSPWGHDAAFPEPLLVGDCTVDPSLAAYAELFAREQIRALAFIPLVSNGRLLGKFMAYWREPHVFTPGEVGVARAIANHLASKIASFEAVADLERTIRVMELFAGVLAHDLRNPLSSIVIATQLMLVRNKGESDQKARPLSRVLSASERMTRMIDQLLDFTRARSGGGIEIRRCDTSLLEIAKQAIAELELVFPARRFELSCTGDPRGSCDPDRLLQVASNLVANACQHGADGPITISIDGTAPDTIALTIHNVGTIPGTLLPTLFDPFRGRPRGGGDSRGLGLGLFIVREIARAHGGDVSVTSTVHEGTSFTVRLPRA